MNVIEYAPYDLCGGCGAWIHSCRCQRTWTYPSTSAPSWRMGHVTPVPDRLSDEDVERIAERLAEKLREHR